MNLSTLSNEALDRIIHEKVMGEHYHVGFCVCPCGKENVNRTWDNPSYCTSWEDYGRLLENIKEHPSVCDFLIALSSVASGRSLFLVVGTITDKRKGCEAIAEYFCKEK